MQTIARKSLFRYEFEMTDLGRFYRTGSNETCSPTLSYNSHLILRPISSSSENAEQVQDIAGVCFISLVALSTLVNSVIIVHFLVKRKYRRSHHMTYLNLAVADLLISVYGTAVRGPGDFFIFLFFMKINID